MKAASPAAAGGATAVVAAKVQEEAKKEVKEAQEKAEKAKKEAEEKAEKAKEEAKKEVQAQQTLQAMTAAAKKDNGGDQAIHQEMRNNMKDLMRDIQDIKMALAK